jgi:hypothetical protein
LRDWFLKLAFKLSHAVARAIEIKPFLRVDVNEYCPACGHRKGKISAVVLQRPDESKSKVGVMHTCAVCSFRWCESSVSVIEHHILDTPFDEEETLIEEMKSDKRTKNIRSKVIVNGVAS